MFALTDGNDNEFERDLLLLESSDDESLASYKDRPNPFENRSELLAALEHRTRNKEIVGESTSDEIISDRLDGPQLEVETDQGASPADG